MKIALVSHFFSPSVGGTEEVAQLLAGEFKRMGHEVRVITTTPLTASVASGAGGADAMEQRILRRPSPVELWRALAWSEVVLHNNLCLQMAWPLLLLRRKWVVAHHIWTRRMDGRRGIRDYLKLLAIRFARNIAVSRAIAGDLPVGAEVIGNPFRDEVFKPMEGVERSKDLLFVGRLTAGKGVDLLLEALHLLEAQGIRRSLTVVGEGPQREQLQKAAGGLAVNFIGSKQPAELARLYNEHRFLVIPSMWNEPFGLVALEAIACGCVPIASNDGGLPEAVGGCGPIFARGNVQELADLLARTGEEYSQYRVDADGRLTHLAKHRAGVVARAYLKILEEA